jgi:hypothetical protein
LKNKNNFEIIHSFFIVRPRSFQTTLVFAILSHMSLVHRHNFPDLF